MAHPYPSLTPSVSFKSSPQPQPRKAHAVDDLSTQLEEDVKVYKARRGAVEVSARENDFWSTFNPLNLGGRIKKGLSAALQPSNTSTASRAGSPEGVRTPVLDDQQAFSLVGASLGARLCLSQMPDDAPLQTVVWACPEPTWGQWPYHSFGYCISVLTEPEARAVYLFIPSPLPPVYQCTLDGVLHLWLVVPSSPTRSVDDEGMMQLSEGQLWAAMEFYERARAEATTDAGQALLLACADGHEVDAVGLAALLLACHCRNYNLNCGPLYDKHSVRYEGSGPGYRASQLIDDDPGVSYIWKGLLMWEDVERVEAVLHAGVSYKMISW
jgi:hypothetical protein